MKEKVIEILREISGCNDITEETSLLDDLGLDSLELVALLVEIEDSFGIELEESDMDPFALANTSDVMELVLKYLEDVNE